MTDAQEEELAQLKAEHGWGCRKLADATGLSTSTVKRWQRRQINKQFNIEDGYKLKGKSVLVDGDGKVKQQWIKTDEDKERTLDLLKLAAEAILEPVKQKSACIDAPQDAQSNLMVVLPIPDIHMGLYAWDEETGESWDADKAEECLTSGCRMLLDSTPAAGTCLVANLADFFHTDTSENKTTRSGHTLDVDTRWAKVFQIGVRAYRAIIEMALEKHEKVIVKSGIGNHDDHSILSLAMLMKAYFENNDRVEVHLPINPFVYHRFGKTLLGITHGGTCKVDKLPGIMAQDMRGDWGEVDHCHWLTGHIHHKSSHEFAGCTVESFRKPGASDFWTHSHGYRSGRDMQALVFDVEKGEISRTRVNT